MAVATRGSWNLDEAVERRWSDAQLDQLIRNEWPIASRLSAKYQVLHDTLARPVPPGPYVIYEKMVPVIRGHMSGSAGAQQENQFQSILIQFGCHAKTYTHTDGQIESGKRRAKRIAEVIAGAFDPKNQPWTMQDDSTVQITRQPDFCTREGEDEWVWVLQYEILIDAIYDQA